MNEERIGQSDSMPEQTDDMSKVQGYYCVIPWKLLTDPHVSSTAKLLYGEISALANREGYCWASNTHFTKIFNIKSSTRISSLIRELRENGYIHTEIDRGDGNSRKIWLSGPIIKNSNSYYQKQEYPIIKNENKDNINIDNKKEIYINDQIKRIYDHYCTAFNKNQNKYKLSNGRKLKIKSRLKEFSIDDILLAIDHASTDSFYSGNNDRHWVADLDYITRSYEVMERLFNLIPRKVSNNGGYKHPNQAEKGKYDDIVER
jgi:hypothetical protein